MLNVMIRKIAQWYCIFYIRWSSLLEQSLCWDSNNPWSWMHTYNYLLGRALASPTIWVTHRPRLHEVTGYWGEPERAPHIYVKYVNSVCLSICLYVGPYVHNTTIYKRCANLWSTFNCWLQLWRRCFLHCFCINKHIVTNKLNKQVIKLRSKFIDH